MKDDLQHLERLNTTFVATAVDRQQEHGFSDRARHDMDNTYTTTTVEERPYEDELGEELFGDFQNQQTDASAAGSNSQSHQPHPNQVTVC